MPSRWQSPAKRHRLQRQPGHAEVHPGSDRSVPALRPTDPLRGRGRARQTACRNEPARQCAAGVYPHHTPVQTPDGASWGACSVGWWRALTSSAGLSSTGPERPVRALTCGFVGRCRTPPTSRGRSGSVSTRSAPEGIRTPNLLIRSQMLYPLSYGRGCRVRDRQAQRRERLPVVRPQTEIRIGCGHDYKEGPSARNRSTSDMASRSPLSHSSLCSPTRRTHQASASERDRATPASTSVSST
jgi:hypothetical protein